jgi:hypothetical protein
MIPPDDYPECPQCRTLRAECRTLRAENERLREAPCPGYSPDYILENANCQICGEPPETHPKRDIKADTKPINRLKNQAVQADILEDIRAENERLREALEMIAQDYTREGEAKSIARAALQSKGEWENESLRIRDEPPKGE